MSESHLPRSIVGSSGRDCKLFIFVSPQLSAQFGFTDLTSNEQKSSGK